VVRAVSKMVERVARALAPGAWFSVEEHTRTDDGARPMVVLIPLEEAQEMKEWSLRQARIAIKTMREPTGAMILVACKTDGNGRGQTLIDVVLAEWEAMIDEALK